MRKARQMGFTLPIKVIPIRMVDKKEMTELLSLKVYCSSQPLKEKLCLRALRILAFTVKFTFLDLKDLTMIECRVLLTIRRSAILLAFETFIKDLIKV